MMAGEASGREPTYEMLCAGILDEARVFPNPPARNQAESSQR